jgi:hypothetical protein
MGTLERSLATQKTDMQHMIEALVTGQPAGVPFDLGLDERFGNLERMLGEQLSGVTRNSTALQERIGVLERSLAGQRNDMTTVTEAIDEELEGMRRALTALGAAQQTLSGAIEEWRADNIGNWSVIQNYLKALPTAAAQPMTNGSSPAAIAATLRPSQSDHVREIRETVTTSAPSMLEKVVDRALKTRMPS